MKVWITRAQLCLSLSLPSPSLSTSGSVRMCIDLSRVWQKRKRCRGKKKKNRGGGKKEMKERRGRFKVLPSGGGSVDQLSNNLSWRGRLESYISLECRLSLCVRANIGRRRDECEYWEHSRVCTYESACWRVRATRIRTTRRARIYREREWTTSHTVRFVWWHRGRKRSGCLALAFRHTPTHSPLVAQTVSQT